MVRSGSLIVPTWRPPGGHHVALRRHGGPRPRASRVGLRLLAVQVHCRRDDGDDFIHFTDNFGNLADLNILVFQGV